MKLGLILALMIQLQQVAICGTGDAHAASPVAAPNVQPVVPQGPGDAPAPPSEATSVATLPWWMVLNQADLDRLKVTKSCVGCELNRADFASADLRGANLSFSNLIGVNLTGANLTGADLSAASQYLSGANLSGADLSFAILSGTIWIDGRICKDTSIGQCD